MDFSMFRLIFLLVPLSFAVIGLVMGFKAGRELLHGRALVARGRQTQGHVISSVVQSLGNSDNPRMKLVETIEFTTDRGQTIRANPTVSDTGMLDRSGMVVEVHHDRERPDRFVAPKNGRSFSAAGPATRILSALGIIIFAGVFITFTQGLLRGFPF